MIRLFWAAGLLLCLGIIIPGSGPLQDWVNPPRKMEFRLPLPEDVALREGVDRMPPVAAVYLSGPFNDWNSKDASYRMRQVSDGTWVLIHQFAPGDNLYKFVVHLENGMGTVWAYDQQNPHLVADGFGGLNSLVYIPDVGFWTFFLLAALGGGAFLLVVVIIFEPLLNWLLRRKFPLRYKLLAGLMAIFLVSASGVVVHGIYEHRGLVRVGLSEQLRLIQNLLLSETGSWDEGASRSRLKKILEAALGSSPPRSAVFGPGTGQTALVELTLLNASGDRLITRTSKTGDTPELARVRSLGFGSLEGFYVKELFGPLVAAAKTSVPGELHTGLHPQAPLSSQDPAVWGSAQGLGFNLVLIPLHQGRSLRGYLGAVIQPRLFGDEIRRIILTNFYILIMSFIAAAFLLLNVGTRLTQHLGQLTAWSEAILRGDYGYTLDLRTGDEIQSLGENLQRLSQGLKDSLSTIEEKNRQILSEAYEDKLTGMPNRHKLFSDLGENRERALMLLNIDGFQKINDFFGHETGDKILLEMGRRLQLLAAREGQVYKISSDEFVLVYDQALTPGSFTDMAQGVLSSLMNRSFQVDGHEVFISITAGGALSQSGSWDPARPALLLAEADMAMKSAKGSPDRFVVFSPSLEIKKEYGRQIIGTKMIRDALKEGRIMPYFQPILDNRTGTVDKYECLARLKDPQGNIITPDHFLDIAKKARFYPFITKVMLFKSMISLRGDTCFFSLNLSMEDLQDAETRSAIESALAANPEVARRMIFEIVESERVKDYEALRDYINVLRRYGCQIAIDDFGTGYSNFEHLIQLKVDYLKIDASLIKNLDSDLNAQSVTRAIVRFAQELGIRTVAEYVHSQAIQDKVLEYGIDFSQGYFIGKPAERPQNSDR